jgi:hypothetical protein
MAEFEIFPGNQRHRRLNYKQKGGAPGRVQDPPTWDLSTAAEAVDPSSLASVNIDPDNMHGVIGHNGAVGDLTISSFADGDVGLGKHPIVITDTFHMRPPRDAEGGTSEVGEEEAIPA